MALVKKLELKNHRHVRVAIFGEGTRSFVILPGISPDFVTDSAAAVAGLFRDFLGDFTVTLIDRVDEVPEGYTMKEMAEDAWEAIQLSGPDRCDLYGASQGGMMALQIAADHPESIDHLFLASTAATLDEQCRRACEDWKCIVKNRDFSALHDSFFEPMYSESFKNIYREAWQKMVPEYPERQLQRFARLAEAMDMLDIQEGLSRIRCKVMVAGAWGDRIIEPDSIIKLSRDLGCPLYMYEKEYGHAVYDEGPGFQKRIKEFLG